MKEFDPGSNAASIVSVTDRVRPLAIGMPVSSVHFLGDVAAFVGAEENVALVTAEGVVSPVGVHGGGILCAASDGTRILLGGDDGKLVALDAKGEVTPLASDPKRRWIDNVSVVRRKSQRRKSFERYRDAFRQRCLHCLGRRNFGH